MCLAGAPPTIGNQRHIRRMRAPMSTGAAAAGITTIMPKTPDYFAAKTIVITGAASGIGRATALTFAREGAG